MRVKLCYTVPAASLLQLAGGCLVWPTRAAVAGCRCWVNSGGRLADAVVRWQGTMAFLPLSYLDGSKGKGEENDAGDHVWHKSRQGERKRTRSLRGACVAAGGEEEQAEPASRRCVASARGVGAEEEEEEETDVARWKFLR
ncbi:unnamed protein product [Miscanthus lutarioriparius]|uniref:Secreted protein n=1 Tax=Miscanthus lutarioriparius TaxID=422564 RepID=A0A811NCH7_9POAL|nr:unnamed protein product [Miscanthus lutarioriparius]